MNESAGQREAIVKRLLSINLSTQNELSDILQLTATVCQSSAILVSLLDKEKHKQPISIGFGKEHTDIEKAFCSHALTNENITEIRDVRLDKRFSHYRFAMEEGDIRFFAGIRLQTQSGETLGSLCLFDVQPKVLTGVQKSSLYILARQVTTILEFESSLAILKEETGKVQDSEMKLKSIFQSSPDLYILIGKDFKIKALNKAATTFSGYLNPKAMAEGSDFLDFVNPDIRSGFIEHFSNALSGQNIVADRKISYEGKEDIWWQAKYNPVYNHLDEIIGVSLTVTDVTDMWRDKENITAQNSALTKIAQIQSHELRRPVANIIELTGILKDKEDENFDLYLSYLRKEVLYLDEKIHQIVELSSRNNISHLTGSGHVTDLQYNHTY